MWDRWKWCRAVVNRVQRAIDGAARDGHLRRFAFGAVVSHRLNVTVDGAAADVQIGIASAIVRPRRNITIDNCVFLNIGIQPVFNRVAVLRVNHTALHMEGTKVNFNGDEVVLREGTTGNGHDRMGLFIAIATDTNKRRAFRSASTTIVLHSAAVEQQKAVLALEIDNVVGRNAGILRGIFTHNGARLGLTRILNGNPDGVDRQRRLALTCAAVEGMAVKVERNRICRDCDVLFRISEQLHRCVARRSVDCCLKAGIARTLNFCNRRRSTFPASFGYRGCYFISYFAGRRIGRFTRRFGLDAKRIA